MSYFILKPSVLSVWIQRILSRTVTTEIYTTDYTYFRRCVTDIHPNAGVEVEPCDYLDTVGRGFKRGELKPLGARVTAASQVFDEKPIYDRNTAIENRLNYIDSESSVFFRSVPDTIKDEYVLVLENWLDYLERVTLPAGQYHIRGYGNIQIDADGDELVLPNLKRK